MTCSIGESHTLNVRIEDHTRKETPWEERYEKETYFIFVYKILVKKEQLEKVCVFQLEKMIWQDRDTSNVRVTDRFNDLFYKVKREQFFRDQMFSNVWHFLRGKGFCLFFYWNISSHETLPFRNICIQSQCCR